MNNHLNAKGFEFTSSYLGDKCILWRFESVAQKEEFIHSRRLWNDVFSAMVRLIESLTPQSRLVWVNCWGIPMSCWYKAFFLKLGW